MFSIKHSILEFEMHDYINFDGLWTRSPEKIIEIIKNNSYRKIVFNFLDCVDFEISGSESILRYICKACRLDPDRVIVAVYDPVKLDYAKVLQGNPFSLASMISHIDHTIDNTVATKKFLGLFNRVTLPRIKMSKFLQETFPSDIILGLHPKINGIYSKEFQDDPEWNSILVWAEKHNPGPKDNINIKSVTEIVESSSKYANDYLIEIVIESNYRILRIVTEKTMKSFIFGKPFIVYAAPGHLKMLRDIGFKTFSPFINEEYDSIDDHKNRFIAIQEEITRLGKISIEELRESIIEMHDILKHNQNLFRSGNFEKGKLLWAESTDFFDHGLLYR